MPQRTTVIHIRDRGPGDVYIGCGSLWGNDWSHLEKSAATFRVATRDESIDCYRQWLEGTDFQTFDQGRCHAILNTVYMLKGKRLVCYCWPQRCHGDILAKLADVTPAPKG